MECKAVICDFDFTLGDSSPGITRCVNHALKQLGFPERSIHEIQPTIGLALPDAFTMLTGETNCELAGRFTDHFVQLADRVMIKHTILIPGALEALVSLKEAGVELAVCTTKYRRRIEAVIEKFSLHEMFRVIVGGDDVARPKPDPDGLFRTCSQLGLEPPQCVYVGDTVVDAQAARAAGMPFIAVTTGVTAPKAFQSQATLAVLASFSEVPIFLSSILQSDVVRDVAGGEAQ